MQKILLESFALSSKLEDENMFPKEDYVHVSKKFFRLLDLIV